MPSDFTELMEEVEKIAGHKLPDKAHAVIGEYIGDIIRRDQDNIKRLNEEVENYKQRDDDLRAEISRHATTNAKQEEQLQNAVAALEETNRFNSIHNDIEAYLFDVAEWGMGRGKEKPDPKVFGVSL
mgnify:CR=1 FL=1